MTVVRRCGSSKGGVSSYRKLCQLMERCDGNFGISGCVGRCDNFQEV